MKKRLIFTIALLAVFAVCFAQKPFKVVFYNMENFFDTLKDPQTFDEEFTPEGPKKWNTAKYTKKLGNIERVLFDIAAIDKNYPAVIGVSEIENRAVLEDIVATKKLARPTIVSCITIRPMRVVSMSRSSIVPIFSNWRVAPPFGSMYLHCPISELVIS